MSFWLSKPSVATGHPWLQVHDFFPEKIVARDESAESVLSRATQRSQYLCVRDNVSLFVHQSHRLAPRKSRSRTVDLRSDRPAGVYETIRHSRDAFIYPHRGSRHSPRLPLISKTRGFVAPVATTGVRIQQGSECLAEFAFRNAFRQQQLKCLAPIRRHGFAMHLGGDRRTCACGYSAGAGRSTCVQTALPGAYETIRHGRDVS